MKRVISVILVIAIAFSLMAGMSVSSYAGFSPRLSAPSKSGWYAGYSRNNCVAYARCRANEILGYSVKWASGNGGQGFWNTSGFNHGSTPKVGAIACWSGHCAVVESVNGSSIVLSEGHYTYQPSKNSGSYKNVVINGGGGTAGTWFDNYYGTILANGKPSECTNQTWYGYVYLMNIVSEKPSISANKSSIALGINSNTSTSITLNCTGSFSSISSSWPDCVSLSGQGWNGGSYTYAVYAKKVGSGTLKFDLKNASGQIVASTSVSISVQGASISASTTSVELYKDGTNTKTVNLTAAGNLPPHYNMKYSVLNGKCRCEWGKWNNQTIPLVISGMNYGTDRISISLINSENNAVVATKTINVNVTSQDYTVNFDANGGTGGPSKITHKYNDYVKLPSTVPTTSEEYTVTFDANGGTLGEVKTVYKKVFDYWYDENNNRYYKGEQYLFKKNITLYAHYSYEHLSAKNPVKQNSYFVGWYDTKIVANTQEPIGNMYNSSSVISKDITLYAAWSSTKNVIFGDVNLDGKVTLSDVSCIFSYTQGKKELTKTQLFFADVNCDGKVTAAKNGSGEVDYGLDGDVNNLFNYVRGNIQYEDLSVVKQFSGITIKTAPKTTYEYGEAFDCNGLVLQSNYKNNSTIHHIIPNDYVITDYNPYKIGKQTVNIHYYSWSIPLEVTVQEPSFLLKLETNGGTISGESTKEVKYTHTYGTLEKPEREGYTFLGWYTQLSGGTKVSSSTVFNQMNDITVYAHWQKQKYTVTFDCNNLSEQIETIKNVEYETYVTIPSTVLSKKGFTFKGWSIVSNSNSENHVYPGDKVLITENTVLYPVWESANEIKEGEFFEYRTEFDNFNKVIKFNPNTSSIYDIQIESQSGIDISVMTGSSKTKEIRKFDSNDFTNVSYYLIAGKTYYFYLSGLDKDESVLIDINEALEHDHKYINSVVNPMATALGYTRHKCEYCDESYQDTYTAPTGKLTLKCDGRNTSAIKVSWNSVKSATGYQVQCSDGGTQWAQTKTGPKTSVTFSGLKAGINYKFRVRFFIKAADGKNYYSPWSKTLNSPTRPGETTLTKLTGAKKAFTAQWKKAGFTGYQVQYSTNAKFTSAKKVTVWNAKTLKATVKNLSGNKTYYVRIRTFKTISNVHYFSYWSKYYKVKTK